MSGTAGTENPKEYLGREKDCVSKIPMRLMLRLARVHKLGADKYGQKNWRVQPVRMSTYYDAMFRHLVTWFETREDIDPESNEHHLLHVIACALIILDAEEHKSITDDRGHTEVKTGKLASPPSTQDTRIDNAVKGLVMAAGRVAGHDAVQSMTALEAQLRGG